MRFVRSQRAAVVEVSGEVLLVGRNRLHRLQGASADLARQVLAFFGRPNDETALVPYIQEASSGQDADVRELLTLLRDVGAIEEVRDTDRQRGINVVVCVSGAIAAIHAPNLVGALQRRGHAVEVALTPTAQRFVAVDALIALLQRDVHTSLWSRAPHVPAPHVALARWADVVVVYPTSATTLARIAGGDFSDLVAAIALTTTAPVLLAPSMNINMLESRSVQRNVHQLRDDGFLIVHGVPSPEVADAPATRASIGAGAPMAGEVAALIDALRSAGALPMREFGAGAHREQWVSDTCDDDIATALAEHVPPPQRLLDVGCGLGQVARHAADVGYRVVATDLMELTLVGAREAAGTRDIVFVRDDICATALTGPYDVIVDRSTLYTLAGPRAYAWAGAIRKLTRRHSTLILKTHRDGVAPETVGISSAMLAALLPEFTLVIQRETELRGHFDQRISSTLFVLRRS